MNGGNQVILEGNQNQFDQNLLDIEAPFGPLELNILERVENGLNIPENENDADYDTKPVGTPPSEKGKYTGPREVIFVSGWVDIDSVYQRYKWGFASKIFIGLLIIHVLSTPDQNFLPVALGFCLINFIHMVKNMFYLLRHRNSNPKIKIVFWLELNVSFGYLIYFTGLALFFAELITDRYLALFSLPYLAFTVILFFHATEDYSILSQKKFQIFEGVQLALILLKISQVGFLNWNYTLLFFMAASIYLMVLGMLLTIILSCSLFGFLYRNLEQWKIRSLIWMTWYYLSSGVVYIYFVKGAIQFYRDDEAETQIAITDYVHYSNQNCLILYWTAILLIVFSFANLIMHMLWQKEIKRYLAKIIYKNELRKEISLRLLTKSFTFKLMQVSATYFMRSDIQKPAPKEGDEKSPPAEKEIQQAIEEELCVFCCEEVPNIMIDPCGHGGICKKCVITYLQFGDIKCPFCKAKLEKIYLLKFNEVEKSFYAQGEINFKN